MFNKKGIYLLTKPTLNPQFVKSVSYLTASSDTQRVAAPETTGRENIDGYILWIFSVKDV